MDGPDTPYTLTIEDRGEYLYAYVKSDTITPEIAHEYLSEITAKCRELGRKHLLLFRDIDAMLPQYQVFAVAQDFIKMIRGIRTAVVNPFISRKEAMDFAVVVSTNRGAVYNVFNNEQEAIAWLAEDFHSGSFAANNTPPSE